MLQQTTNNSSTTNKHSNSDDHFSYFLSSEWNCNFNSKFFTCQTRSYCDVSICCARLRMKIEKPENMRKQQRSFDNISYVIVSQLINRMFVVAIGDRAINSIFSAKKWLCLATTSNAMRTQCQNTFARHTKMTKNKLRIALTNQTKHINRIRSTHIALE